MAPQTTETKAFSGPPEAEALLEYRPLSRLCLLALLIGLFSPLALLNPAFAIIGLATLVLGAVALWSASSQQRGRALAVFAILLAVSSVAWGTSRYLSRRQTLVHQAERFADRWWSVVQEGDLRVAHQLTLAYAERSDASLLDEVYEPPVVSDYVSSELADSHPHNLMKDLFGSAPLNKIQEMGENFDYQLQGVEFVQFSDGGSVQVGLRYRVRPHSGDASQPVEALLVLNRQVSANVAFWNVANIEDPLKPRNNLAERTVWDTPVSQD